MPDVTRILHAIDQGDPHAAKELLPLVYNELRQLAAAKLAHEKPGQTLDATGLVHEAYLRLIQSSHADASRPEKQFANRRHFFAAAAEAMRRILVENARRRHSQKHGGGRKRIDFADADKGYLANDYQVLAIDEAMQHLAADDPQAAELVKLRYFGGLSIEEAAESLGISRSTAYEHWAYARASLRLKLAADERG